MKNEKTARARVERLYKKHLAQVAILLRDGIINEKRAENDRARLRQDRREDLKTIETASTAGAVVWCRIEVEWKKSRTWGNCPRVRLECGDGSRVWYSSGYASGCGYDKESAAVCDAVRDCPPLVRLLIENAGRIRKYRGGVYGVSRGEKTFPRWSFSGCGMSSFLGVFRKGYDLEARADLPALLRGFKIEEGHTRTGDFYYITRKRRTA